MKIGFSSTGRSMVENVYKRFGNCPAYLIYNTENNNLDIIVNYGKYQEGCGPQAAQLLANRNVDIVITDEIDDRSYEILVSNKIDVYSGYPGTCEEALQKFNSDRLSKVRKYSALRKRVNRNQGADSLKSHLDNFEFLNLEVVFKGEKILFSDWELLLHQKAMPGIPDNWLTPVNYVDGIYHINLEILEMQNTSKPVEFEISWLNYPEKKHPNIPHRCSFGYYCMFSSPGVYEHIAKIKDMENTSVNGKEETWCWEAGWDSPFCLIKPYGQKPFPVRARFQVTVYAA
jgi:predicted Fe-Mo cluster-binding NifX family protein